MLLYFGYVWCIGLDYFVINKEAKFIEVEESDILDENKWVSFKILKYLGYVLSMTKYKEIERSIDLFKQAIEIRKDDIRFITGGQGISGPRQKIL